MSKKLYAKITLTPPGLIINCPLSIINYRTISIKKNGSSSVRAAPIVIKDEGKLEVRIDLVPPISEWSKINPNL